MAGNVVARPPSGRQSALLDNRLPAQQQERKPQEPPPPATANADAGSSRATRQSYAGPLTKPPAGTSLDEFTEQLDAYAAGRVEDMPTRPLSTIRAVQSVGSNLSSRRFLVHVVCVCHVCVCCGVCVCVCVWGVGVKGNF